MVGENPDGQEIKRSWYCDSGVPGMKKAIAIAVLLAFATPSFAATSTTWKKDKKTKAWTVKTKKLKTTLEIIRDIKKRERKYRR